MLSVNLPEVLPPHNQKSLTLSLIIFQSHLHVFSILSYNVACGISTVKLIMHLALQISLLEISHNSDFKSHRENISISSLKRKLFLGREPRGARSLDSSVVLGEESVVCGHCAQSRLRGNGV